MFDNQTYDRFSPADDITVHAAKAVKGRHLVAFTGNETDGHAQVQPATAGSYPAGVAAYDATEGNLVGLKRGNRVITVAASSDIPSGTAVEVGEDGTVIAHTSGQIVGTVYAKGDIAGTVLVAINL
ncbi:hypothetical protein [Corynebacterium marquesiae]|uniref:hypothetical protein n=1 Tax=Corynebacterium marquesiae TaxID=2913503 RepID=UPI0038D17262